MNLRERQKAAIGKMLTIQQNGGKSTGFKDLSDQWKVLVYDRDCMDIISPLLNIGELREYGVTLHMLLEGKRDPITDAPAVYFMRPTEENILRLIEDCKNGLYRSFHVHFVTRIDRTLMETFAKGIVAVNAASLINGIIDFKPSLGKFGHECANPAVRLASFIVHTISM